jgi:hypothetical protein
MDRLTMTGDTTLGVAGCGLVDSGPTKRDQETGDRASEVERCEDLLV